MKRFTVAATLVLPLLFAGSAAQAGGPGRGTAYAVRGGNVVVEFDSTLRSRVISTLGGKETPLGGFAATEFARFSCTTVSEFPFRSATAADFTDTVGRGRRYEIIGDAPGIRKTIRIESYDPFPEMLLFTVSYTNTGTSSVTCEEWTNNRYAVTADPSRTPGLWSYQPGSYGWDNDWVLPVGEGYARDNYLGMTGPDYGGGTPVADLWRPDAGVAVGHVEPVPKLVSLPVSMTAKTEAQLGVTYRKPVEVKPGETIATFRTFAIVHQGDHFNSLTVYRRFMEKLGFLFTDPPEEAYGTEWCSWGYERELTLEEFRGTIPKVRELGLEWIVLDMGWFTRIGDFAPSPAMFPHGEPDMVNLVKEVHGTGAKGQLWWMPLGAEPTAEVFTKHPEYLILDEDGSPRYMPTFFGAFFLCPASKEVREYFREQVTHMMRWGWDGLKIDGYNLNFVPPCYNPLHKHARPEESMEQLPAFHRLMFESARSVNPRAKIEICPCGTNQSFYILPYMNETVASDPHNSRHVRIKGKTLRALTGPKMAFYGDHVELSDEKEDFASTIGVGGTIGTKFVYPPGVHMNKETGDVTLTPEKEKRWKKWIAIYKEQMLPKGEYLGGLYDFGFDIPEAHAIRKGGRMYYAFYAPSHAGPVELRGLEDRAYTVVDYEKKTTLGRIRGPVAKLDVTFARHLLIYAE